MNRRNAQINQVFVMIFAIIIIAAVALLGLRSVGSLLDDKCTVEMVTFKDKVIGTIADRNTFGSVSEERFSSPCGMATLCLIDQRAINRTGEYRTAALASGVVQDNFILTNSIQDTVEKNIFLIDGDRTLPVGYSPQLQLETADRVLCQDARSGTFTFIMSGQGRFTSVRNP